MSANSPSVSLLCAALAVLAAGCFERAAPRRDVTAFSPAEAAALRETATFLDFSLAEDLRAFPDDLGSFPALRRVSVRGQKAAAVVPASVADAKGLYELDLAGTGLKDLPPEAASLPALRNLYLSDNGLGSLPAAVCGMKGLTYLNLDRNALTNLPDAVGDLAALKWVRLNGNKLRDLPASAAAWTDVRRLYLRGNGLKEVPPVVLQMTSLEEIDLGDNDLAELPEGLCALPKLHRIDLDGNPRLAKLPESMAGMKQLTHLFAFRTGLPASEKARVREALPDPVRHFMAF